MKNHSLPLLCFILFITALSGCSKDNNDKKVTQNEYLVKSELLADVSLADIKARFPGAAGLVTSSVKAYKLSYKTEFPAGNPTNASGLVIIPDQSAKNLTLLGFLHGTITSQDEAPSEYKPAGNMEAYSGGTVAASTYRRVPFNSKAANTTTQPVVITET